MGRGGARRCRRRSRCCRDRHPVLRPGDGRTGDPAGVAGGPRCRCHTAGNPRRRGRAGRRDPVGGDDVLQHRPPRRAPSVRRTAGRRRGRPDASFPTFRWKRPSRGRGRPTMPAWRRSCWPPRPPRTSASAGSSNAPGASCTRWACSGVTGERSSSPRRRPRWPRGCCGSPTMPVLVGVGVSNAEQAREACVVADGVVQGASVVRRLIENGPDAVGDYVAEVRAAIDTPDRASRRARAAARSLRWADQHRRAGRRDGDIRRTRAAPTNDDRRATGSLATRRRVPDRRHRVDRCRDRLHRDHGDVRVPAGAVLRLRREGPPRLRPRDRRLPAARDRPPAGRTRQRHAVADRSGRPAATHAIPRRVGSQPPTAALRRRRRH